MKAKGTTVTINSTPIGKLKPNIDLTGASVTNIETTAHDTANNSKTFIGGLIDNGNMPLQGAYDPTDAGQIALMAAVGTNATFVRALPGGFTETFSGVVGPMNISAPIDGECLFTCEVKISGAITRHS